MAPSALYAAQVDDGSVVQVVTMLAAVIGVIWGGWQLQQLNRHQRLDLGNLYLQRYWVIDDDLLRLAKGTPEHRHARHRYLRLCEDEFEAATLRWIDAKQWNVWHSWITTPTARETLTADIETCDSQGERFKNVRLCLTEPANHSWNRCPANEPSTKRWSPLALHTELRASRQIQGISSPHPSPSGS